MNVERNIQIQKFNFNALEQPKEYKKNAKQISVYSYTEKNKRFTNGHAFIYWTRQDMYTLPEIQCALDFGYISPNILRHFQMQLLLHS